MESLWEQTAKEFAMANEIDIEKLDHRPLNQRVEQTENAWNQCCFSLPSLG